MNSDDRTGSNDDPVAADHEPGAPDAADAPASESASPARPREIGGRDGPEPTRFGDWEKNGRCIDF